MDKEALYHKLRDYLDGKLPEEESKALQSQIAVDEAVAEQLEMARLERDLAGLMIDNELEGKMKQWSAEKQALSPNEADTNARTTIPSSNSRNLWLIGLLLLVFLAILVYWLWQSSNKATYIQEIPREELQEGSEQEEQASPSILDEPSNESTIPEEETQKAEPEKKETRSDSRPIAREERPEDQSDLQQLALATAARTSPIGVLNIRSSNVNEEELPLQKGYRLMGEGKLEEALEVLSSIPQEPRGMYLNAQQYLAYVYFEQKNYQAAKPIFADLVDIGYADKEKMSWYLALAYLATGEETKGLALVNEVAKNSKNRGIQDAALVFLEALK